jgi:hypothetical protein
MSMFSRMSFFHAKAIANAMAQRLLSELSSFVER